MNKFVARNIKIKIAVFLCLFMAFFLLIDFNLRPIVKCAVGNSAEIIAVEAINEAVGEEMAKKNDVFSDIINVHYKDGGDISAVSSNMSKINELKFEISLAIQRKLSEIKEKNLGIPLGSLTGLELFSGRGILVPIKLFISGNVNVDFKSDFSSTGINQTKHKLFLNVKVTISSVVPGCSNKTEVNTNIPISETLVIGSVPKFYSTTGAKCFHENAETFE